MNPFLFLFLDLFQDLSQLQEIWIAEGELMRALKKVEYMGRVAVDMVL